MKSGVIVRCNLVEMYYAGAVQPDTIIDVATREKWMAFLEHDQSKWGQEVEDLLVCAMKLSTSKRELLFKWRGNLPLAGVRTMDADTGRAGRTLIEFITGHVGPDFFERSDELTCQTCERLGRTHLPDMRKAFATR